MYNAKRVSLAVSAFMLVLLLVTFAGAQYSTQQTSTATITVDGTVHIDQSATTGAVLDIVGTPGANVTVTTAVYTENPYPNAVTPGGVTLSNFMVVSFGEGTTFTQANLTFHYTDADVAGMTEPYAIYKYIPETNTFIELATVVDTVAKTMTVTLNSPTDPLFAVGGATVTTSPTPTSSATATASVEPSATPAVTEPTPVWVWAAVAVVVIVVIAVLAFMLLKRKK